jgi:hypothetical protein
MPGPVSDSYDPEFGTASNAAEVKEAIEQVRDRVTRAIGTERLESITDVAACLLSLGELARTDPHMKKDFITLELRLIRFCMNRVLEEI